MTVLILTRQILLLGAQAAKSKLSDYVATLDGTLCVAVNNLGVIIDSSLSFEVHVDNITRMDLFHLRNRAKIINVMSPHNA